MLVLDFGVHIFGPDWLDFSNSVLQFLFAATLTWVGISLSFWFAATKITHNILQLWKIQLAEQVDLLVEDHVSIFCLLEQCRLLLPFLSIFSHLLLSWTVPPPSPFSINLLLLLFCLFSRAILWAKSSPSLFYVIDFKMRNMLPDEATLPVLASFCACSSVASPRMIDVLVGNVASNSEVSKPESRVWDVV